MKVKRWIYSFYGDHFAKQSCFGNDFNPWSWQIAPKTSMDCFNNKSFIPSPIKANEGCN